MIDFFSKGLYKMRFVALLVTLLFVSSCVLYEYTTPVVPVVTITGLQDEDGQFRRVRFLFSERTVAETEIFMDVFTLEGIEVNHSGSVTVPSGYSTATLNLSIFRISDPGDYHLVFRITKVTGGCLIGDPFEVTIPVKN